MRLYVALRIYHVSRRRSRYHGLTQIQSYTWSHVDTYTRVSGVVYAVGRYPYSVTRTHLFAAEHSFSYQFMPVRFSTRNVTKI